MLVKKKTQKKGHCNDYPTDLARSIQKTTKQTHSEDSRNGNTKIANTLNCFFRDGQERKVGVSRDRGGKPQWKTCDHQKE